MLENHAKSDHWEIIISDCIDAMNEMEPNSIDCIACDPPYGIGFMNKVWDKVKDFDKRAATPDERSKKRRESYKDHGILAYVGTGLSEYAAGPIYQDWTYHWAIAALRVLKPGGLMFVMGHPRTFHRLVCGVEDSGFEIIDVVQWVYWTGFPKAYDIGKGFDKQAGKKKVIGTKKHARKGIAAAEERTVTGAGSHGEARIGEITEPVTELAKQWNGWKSAKGLKPAHEPILMTQKPKSEKTICKNVEKWGVGGINVDATRIPTEDVIEFNKIRPKKMFYTGNENPTGYNRDDYPSIYAQSPEGRFPANIIAESGVLGDKTRFVDIDAWAKQRFGVEYWKFIDVPKPHKKEKDAGLDGERSTHPTVKPVKLFLYLLSLGCPPGGTVLDPFGGSGTTNIAALKLGLRSIYIDKTPEYAAIAKARIQHAER